jgi:hypothetical protein
VRSINTVYKSTLNKNHLSLLIASTFRPDPFNYNNIHLHHVIYDLLPQKVSKHFLK